MKCDPLKKWLEGEGGGGVGGGRKREGGIWGKTKIFFAKERGEKGWVGVGNGKGGQVMPALSAVPEIYILPNPLKDLSIFLFFPHVRKNVFQLMRGKAWVRKLDNVAPLSSLQRPLKRSLSCPFGQKSLKGIFWRRTLKVGDETKRGQNRVDISWASSPPPSPQVLFL